MSESAEIEMANGSRKVPLSQWIKGELSRQAREQNEGPADNLILLKSQCLLRRTTVAYGIAELLRHAARIKNASIAAAASTAAGLSAIENFVVQVSSREASSWNDVTGVSMISPPLEAEIFEPSFLSDLSDDQDSHDMMGLYVEVHVNTPQLPEGNSVALEQAIEAEYCNACGMLFYELYSGTPPSSAEESGGAAGGNNSKRSAVRYDKRKGKSYSTSQHQPYHDSLQEMGFPSSICSLVQNLISGHDVYPSLKTALPDIHLLLSDPECYLLDLNTKCIPADGNVQLQVREGKVYGRENEVTLITEAFCRVSTGKSEAFFIGGYSGSGKTMLVNSLTARVGIAGCYVLAQKVDQISKERPLLEVLAAFNKLCLLVRDQSSHDELILMAKKLLEEFEDDFPVLAKLVPNIHLICPRVGKSPAAETANDQIYLAHNVHFTLQRFVRIVSSKEKPVMLFLDDLQWAGASALDLIHAILSDERGDSCFFFVGSYRDNEVGNDHPLLQLIAKLQSASVGTTTVKLSGLDPESFNLMLSEMLCVFPHLCRPLSKIVLEKTEGNPFFALEFLSSLVNSRLLKYSLRERRWIWDEEEIRSENITDNVLYLLSNKLHDLPENVQLSLKVLSCFGNKVHESVVDRLSLTEQYSGIKDWLGRAISERCIHRVDAEYYVFTHDKVLECSYGLIDDNEKGQFHHDLGFLLYTVSKDQGDDLSVLSVSGSFMFHMVDQINRDLSLIPSEKKLDIAELNFEAGTTAMDRGDFTTAYQYLTNALELLPSDHWDSFSLRLYFLRAKAAYSCGFTDDALESLSAILDKGRDVSDTTDAHHYNLIILQACGKRAEAFASCMEFLSEHGESIPDFTDANKMADIVERTEEKVSKITEQEWMAMKDLENSSFQAIIRVYAVLQVNCYYYKPGLMSFPCSRMIELSLEHGLCRDSIVGLVQFASLLCIKSNAYIEPACRIGKAVMNVLSKRFDSPEMVSKLNQYYYGFVGVHIESLESCIENLRKGYKVGMSVGDTAGAFQCALFIARLGVLSGAKLRPLLEEIDYYLKTSREFDHALCQHQFVIFREVASVLIGNGTPTNQGSKGESSAEDPISSSEAYLRPLYVGRALQSFWLGYSDRCSHYVDKLISLRLMGCHNQRYVMFYGALNSFRGIRTKKVNQAAVRKVKKLYKDAMRYLKHAASLYPPGFTNKMHLLDAENFSFDGKNEEAKAEYATAIALSRDAGSISDQGLAEETAAIHYKYIGDRESARAHFNLAKECYAEWGSQMKVDYINRQLEMLA